MSRSGKVVSGVFWGAIMNVLSAVYGFISVPILLDYFGKGEYGLIGLATSVNVYVQLMDLGMSSTNVRFFSVALAKKEYVKLNKLFQSTTAFYGVIGIINALILIGAAFFSDEIFNVTPEQDVIMKQLFYILAAMAVVNWYTSSFYQMINATENVAWGTKLSIIPRIWMLVVLFVTVYCKMDIVLYFLLTYASLIITIPALVKKINREVKCLKFWPSFDKNTFREILPYGLNVFSFGFFQFSFYNLRPVFLGMQGSPEDVADFRVLNGIAGTAMMFASPVMSALLPSSSRIIANKDKTAYYKLAYSGTLFMTLIISFCCFGLMSVAPELIELYVGENYLHLVVWLYFWLFFILGNHNLCISSLILAGSDIRAITYISIFSSIMGLVLTWLLIPIYGVGGAIVALAVYMTSQIGFYYLYYWPKVMEIDSLRVFSRSFAPYAIIGLSTALFISFYVHFGFSLAGEILSKGILFMIVFISLSFCIMSKEDRQYLLQLVMKRRK